MHSHALITPPLLQVFPKSSFFTPGSRFPKGSIIEGGGSSTVEPGVLSHWGCTELHSKPHHVKIYSHSRRHKEAWFWIRRSCNSCCTLPPRKPPKKGCETLTMGVRKPKDCAGGNQQHSTIKAFAFRAVHVCIMGHLVLLLLKRLDLVESVLKSLLRLCMPFILRLEFWGHNQRATPKKVKQTDQKCRSRKYVTKK